MDGKVVRVLLKQNYREICEILDCGDLIKVLFTNKVIERKELQHLVRVEQNYGCIRQAEVLLEYLQEKTEGQLQEFIEVLKEEQQTVYDLLCNSSNVKGIFEDFIKDITSKLQTHYIDKCGVIEQLPGERFVLDLSNKDLVMPLDVTVEVVDKSMLKLERRLRDAPRKYKKIKVAVIDEVFTCGFERTGENSDPEADVEQDKKYFLCTGIAGTGKTVVLQRFAFEWASGKNPNLQTFDMLFLIPLRSVNLHLKVIDILGGKEKCLGYIRENQKEVLHNFLNDEQNARKVIFVIDGIDEVDLPEDCELYLLLVGELYTGSTVFITSRPDTDALAKLKVFQPDIRIHINGTNREGIFRYIEASLVRDGGPSREDAQTIIKECEKRLFSFDVLHVPLYLALITVVFDQFFVKHASFAAFKVPHTMTQLFNSFMNILIKLWLRRTYSNIVEEICTFKHCPVGQGSSLPVDIQAKMFLFGRISFDFLFKRCYQFSEKDLMEYLVDKQDVKMSGMFCFDSEALDGQDCFYFRHKTLQEYLAAVYLSQVKFNDSKFLQMFNRSPDEHLIMDEIFSPLQLCIKFLFALDPEFGIEIVNKLKSRVWIARNTVTADSCIDLLYLSELCLEGSHEPLTMEMENLLMEMNCTDKQFEVYNQYASFPVLHEFAKLLPRYTGIKLLSKHYNLDIQLGMYSGKNSSIKQSRCRSSEMTKLDIESLDLLCLAFLSTFTFPYIKTVVAKKSMVMDVGLLQIMFPSMEQLEVNGYPHYDITSPFHKPNCSGETSLKSVTLNNTYSLFSRPLPPVAFSNLTNQTGLTTLNVHRINILTDSHSEFQLHSLKSLDIHIDLLSSSIKEACHLLKYCASLSELHIEAADDRFKCDGLQTSELLTCVTKHCKRMERLVLINVFNLKGLKSMMESLPKMKIKTLGISERDFSRFTELMVDCVISCCISCLDIYCSRESKIKLPEIIRKLHECDWIKVNYKFHN